MGKGNGAPQAGGSRRRHVSAAAAAATEPAMVPGATKDELLIDGRLYDVTEFQRKHPGGRVLRFYLGADASQPFHEFHNRSGKAPKYLKSLPSRPYTGKPRTDALVRDFETLRDELEEEGYFKPNLAHVAYRLVELVLMHVLGAWLMTRGWYWSGLAMLGLAQGRCGWLMHEGGHYSLTSSIPLDRAIQVLCYGVGCGMSAAWWRNQHNKHHATPQKLGMDVDLDTLPLVSFNKAIAAMRPKFANKSWLRLQAFLFAPVTCFLVSLGWQLFLHPRHIVRTKRVWEGVCLLSRFVLAAVLASKYGALPVLGAYCVYVWIGAVYIFVNFAVSHTHLPVVAKDEHKDWVRYASEHTMNVSPNPMTNWWMSYLNFQIEHHLFPSMPQFRHPRVSPRVRALFAKHGVPYLQRGYWDSLRVTFGNLHRVGHDVFYG